MEFIKAKITVKAPKWKTAQFSSCTELMNLGPDGAFHTARVKWHCLSCFTATSFAQSCFLPASSGITKSNNLKDLCSFISMPHSWRTFAALFQCLIQESVDPICLKPTTQHLDSSNTKGLQLACSQFPNKQRRIPAFYLQPTNVFVQAGSDFLKDDEQQSECLGSKGFWLGGGPF